MIFAQKKSKKTETKHNKKNIKPSQKKGGAKSIPYYTKPALYNSAQNSYPWNASSDTSFKAAQLYQKSSSSSGGQKKKLSAKKSTKGGTQNKTKKTKTIKKKLYPVQHRTIVRTLSWPLP